MTLQQWVHIGRKFLCFGLFGLGGLIVSSIVFSIYSASAGK